MNLEGDGARRGSSALRLADDAARQAPRPRGDSSKGMKGASREREADDEALARRFASEISEEPPTDLLKHYYSMIANWLKRRS